ncbi:hypothetical protein NIES2104_12430 [Leptolyngbya sp. NIES-2104]|nr:hypothetical protein NIES2104_12430 [Leptolyngbya sp. NIES-2104]
MIQSASGKSSKQNSLISFAIKTYQNRKKDSRQYGFGF